MTAIKSNLLALLVSIGLSVISMTVFAEVPVDSNAVNQLPPSSYKPSGQPETTVPPNTTDANTVTTLSPPVNDVNALPQAETPSAAPVETPPVATVPVVVLPVVEAPPAPAPTAPFSVNFDKISAGDTAWMLSSTALVLLMTIPGLVLFYAGMVRKKNVLSTSLQSFAICCLVTVIWVVIGYSLAFTPGSTPYLGGLDRLMLSGLDYVKATSTLTVSHIAPTIPESVFVMFQMTFAIITPALIVGAFAERMRFTAMLMFMSLWSIFVYAPVAHWVWEPSGSLL